MDGSLYVLSCCVTAYWALVICMTFFKGFYQNGELIMSKRRIALHYFKRTFVLDLAVVVADITTISFRSSDSSGIMSVPRMCRLLKVLRIARMFDYLENSLRTCFRNTIMEPHCDTCLWFRGSNKA